MVVDRDIIAIGWDDQHIVCRQGQSACPDSLSPCSWWIIDIRKNAMYGPLDEPTYEVTRRRIRVAESTVTWPTRSYHRDGTRPEGE